MQVINFWEAPTSFTWERCLQEIKNGVFVRKVSMIAVTRTCANCPNEGVPRAQWGGHKWLFTFRRSRLVRSFVATFTEGLVLVELTFAAKRSRRWMEIYAILSCLGWLAAPAAACAEGPPRFTIKSLAFVCETSLSSSIFKQFMMRGSPFLWFNVSFV